MQIVSHGWHLMQKEHYFVESILQVFLFHLEFESWKETKEEEEQTSFRLAATTRNKQNEVVLHFQCNRSGFYVERKSRLRHLKAGGDYL